MHTKLVSKYYVKECKKFIAGSAGHSYATMCTYFPVPFNRLHEQVCLTVRKHLSDANRGGGAGQPLTKELLHCYLTHACPTMLYIHLVISMSDDQFYVRL